MSSMDRVLNGAKWLDENRPGWFNEIDIQKLDLHSCGRCVLGQLFGNFIVALDTIFQNKYRPGGWQSSSTIWAIDHGFERPYHCDMVSHNKIARFNAEYDALRECWLTVILERQFQASEAHSMELVHHGK